MIFQLKNSSILLEFFTDFYSFEYVPLAYISSIFLKNGICRLWNPFYNKNFNFY